MPKNWLSAISVISLIAIQLQVDAAWKTDGNKKSNKKEEKATMPQGMYHYDDRNFFIRGDYLFWLPQQEDLFYTAKASSPGGQEAQISYKQPEFGLSSGVRLEIGGFTTDRWDVGLTGMYIYGEGSSRSGSNGDLNRGNNNNGVDSGSGIVPDFNPFLFSFVRNSSVKIRLNHFVGDLTFGREFFLTRRFAIHPIIGIRGFDVTEHLVATYRGRSDDVGGSGGNPDGVISTDSPQHFKAHNDLYGVGPRAGIDLSFYLGNHFAILGGFSGSLLLTRYHTHQKYEFLIAKDTSSGGVASGSYQSGLIKTKDTGLLSRANVDAYFGLGWDNWYNNDKNRVHIALLFEASQWFGFNQINDSIISFGRNNSSNNNGDGAVVPDLRRHGDLGYIGGTLRFQLDF